MRVLPCHLLRGLKSVRLYFQLPRGLSSDTIKLLKNKMAEELTEVSSNVCYGGYQKVFSHKSTELDCVMKFSVFLPPQAESEKVPVLYYLSGLTCTEQNFMLKGEARRYAAEEGIMIVGPDTSPRGCNIEGEDDSYDFGSGAGFYLDATEEKWKKNYRMFTYVTQELHDLIQSKFPVVSNKQSIMGHSMGGHGALVCALKKPGFYRSASAFSPICNPMKCPWGQKAFTGYLGPNQGAWKEYDASELVKKYSGPPLDILIDQGTADEFYPHQLLPDNLVEASKSTNVKVTLRMQEDYDHSYYFISTFMGDHVKHHTKYLKA
ncbi:S-formylglutathione hydrolase [Exaiptasia diaphana]|uniref:S-formylglutathione hydrolase n=1 Tax=Exaiptasia diaphana TaxID=2652724 RepID=A0A913XG24_EXADI|nr:S-formylglutathione hydrolase [Exaiptasia diaphana]KXJ26183.1 S-formylglutathione hydrolase [Exaiptasia diaphana]